MPSNAESIARKRADRPAILHVKMLGGFSVALEGRYIHGELGSSGRRLASFLFSHPGRSHRRERLIDLFWQESDSDRGRGSLNTALWRVRRMLASANLDASALLSGNTSEIIFSSDDLIEIDAQQFNILGGEALKEIDTADLESLRVATRMYSGPFLDGDDDDWLLAERERLHCLNIRLLSKLLVCHVANRHFEDALECGRQILNSDPTRETIHRRMMLLYVANGQRGEALRQFDRCRRLMRSECGVEAMKATADLAAQIRASARVEDLSGPWAANFDGRTDENAMSQMGAGRQ